MSKIREFHYAHQSAQGLERTTWELDFFPEATIRKIVVKQVGGTPMGFTLDIFNNRKGGAANSQSSGGEDEDGSYSLHPDVYRVIGTLGNTYDDAQGGGLMKFWDEGTGPMFVNTDPKNIGGNTLRKIYLEIEPQGTGETTWDVCIGGENNIG